MRLQEIGLKYQTDKATYHKYLDFYEQHIKRESVKRFLEIGIYKGQSIKMWRDWLDAETIVEGWDINTSIPIDNCDLKIVDQTNKKQMRRNVSGMYDVILDDGAHTTETIQKSFSVLFKYCKMYIIEDLHAPFCDKNYIKAGDVDTINILNNIKKDGWSSRYSTKKETKYVNKNAEILDLFWRGDKDKPESMSVIIINKDNLNNNPTKNFGWRTYIKLGLKSFRFKK